MIMGISSPCEIGSIVKLDFIEGGERYPDRPVMILGAATAEDWVRYRVDEEGYDETSVRQGLARWLEKLPGLKFYQVSVD